MTKKESSASSAAHATSASSAHASSRARDAAAAPALEVSYGAPAVQPRGFSRGTVDVIGCMAGDWDVRMRRNISAESTGEAASGSASKSAKERY